MMMRVSQRLSCFKLASLLLVCFLSLPTIAQNYPKKPIVFVVPFGPGGSGDLMARTFAQYLEANLKQTVIVDNKPGADGMVGTEFVKNSAPDGYTLLLTTNTTMAANAVFYKKLSYDPIKDFTPIGLATYVPYCLFINSQLPANNLTEFLSYAKSRPGQLNYSSPGIGTPNHIGGAMLVTLGGINLLHVPYKLGAQSIADLIAGTIQVSITGLLTTMPHVRAARVKLLGCGTQQRLQWAPDVPAINETIPGYYNTGWWGLVGPKGLDKKQVQYLNQSMNRWLKMPATVQRFQVAGLEVSTTSPDSYREQILSDLNTWRTLIKDSHITVDSLP
jgi:tripartite-type tricarboxylate transporter receptor subunit TctC